MCIRDRAHGLEKINIFDEHAVVVEGYGEFTGMTVSYTHLRSYAQ